MSNVTEFPRTRSEETAEAQEKSRRKARKGKAYDPLTFGKMIQEFFEEVDHAG